MHRPLQFTNILILLSCFTFISCNDRNRTIYENTNGQLIKKTITQHGSCVVIQQLNADSIPNGVCKVLIDNTLMDYGVFKNGKKDSVWIHFTPDGDTSYLESWYNGKKYGQEIWYFERLGSSHLLKPYKYKFNDTSRGKSSPPYCEIYFDKNGGVTYSRRAPIFIHYNKPISRVNDTLIGDVLLGVPPACKFNLGIMQINVANKKVEIAEEINERTDSNLTSTIYGRHFVFSKQHKKAGQWLWLISLQEWDSKQKRFISSNDTLNVNIN